MFNSKFSMRTTTIATTTVYYSQYPWNPFISKKSFLRGNQSRPYPLLGLQLHLTTLPRLPWDNSIDVDKNLARNVNVNVFGLDPNEDERQIIPLFGREIRHLRLDYNPLDLAFARFDCRHLGLSNLRVLIIRPKITVGRGYWEPTLEAQPYIEGRLGLPLQRPYHLACPGARDQATQLAKQNLWHLRFIVIHNEYFWIDRISPKKKRGAKVWVRKLVNRTPCSLPCILFSNS